MFSGISYIPGFADSNLVDRIVQYSKAHEDEFSDYGNREQEFKVHTYHEIEKNDSQLLVDMQLLAKRVYSSVLESYGGEFSEFLETKNTYSQI